MTSTAREIKNKQSNSTIFEIFDPSNQPQSPNIRTSNNFMGSDIFGAKAQEDLKTNSPQRSTSQRYGLFSPTYKSNVFFPIDKQNGTTKEGDGDANMSNADVDPKKSAEIALRHSKTTLGWDPLSKSPKKHGQQPSFTPKFENLTSKQRAIKEFFGQDALDKISQKAESNYQNNAVQKTNTNETTGSMRAKELSSSIFGESQTQYPQSPNKGNARAKDNSIRPSDAKWIDSSSQRKVKNVSGIFGGIDNESFVAARRANENKSSIIFGDNHTDLQKSFDADVNVSNRRIKLDMMDHLNEDIRQKQPMFSDLFGIPIYEKPAKQVPEKQEAPEDKQNGLESSEKEAGQSVRNDYESQHETESVKTSKENEVSKPKYAVPGIHEIGSELNLSPITKGEKAKELWAKEFKLTSIPKSLNDDALKTLFAGFHIIKLESDVKLLSGSTLGTGKVSLRNDNPKELAKLKERLKEAGIFMLPKEVPKLHKKNRYSDMAKVKWYDEKLELEGHRLTSGNYSGAKETRKKDLVSEKNVFNPDTSTSEWSTDWAMKSFEASTGLNKKPSKQAPSTQKKTPSSTLCASETSSVSATPTSKNSQKSKPLWRV